MKTGMLVRHFNKEESPVAGEVTTVELIVYEAQRVLLWYSLFIFL